MATVALTKDIWTEIAAADTSGFFANRGPAVIQFTKGTVAPTTNVGSGMQPGPVGMNFELSGGNKMYARPTAQDGEVFVDLN